MRQFVSRLIYNNQWVERGVAGLFCALRGIYGLREPN
jgi:hypothetical protein